MVGRGDAAADVAAVIVVGAAVRIIPAPKGRAVCT